MMARQHVTFAVGVASTTLAVTAYVAPAVQHWVQEHWVNAFMMLILIAGGALVPDIDHPNSTITRKMGLAGLLLNAAIRAAGIRHRGFFHSLFFAVIAGVVGLIVEALIGVTAWAAIALGVMFLFYSDITFGFLFGSRGRSGTMLLLTAAALIFGFSQGYITTDGHWLAIGAFAGPLLHDVGDMLTRGKVYFFAPFSTRGVSAPVGFATGGIFESVVLRTVFFLWSLAGISWVFMMGNDMLVRADLAAIQTGQSLPYLLWVLAP